MLVLGVPGLLNIIIFSFIKYNNMRHGRISKFQFYYYYYCVHLFIWRPTVALHLCQRWQKNWFRSTKEM